MQSSAHIRAFHHHGFTGLAAAMVATACLIALVTGSVAGADGSPSKGVIPNSAFRADGSIAAEQVPDFVTVWNREGTAVAGYVPKNDLIAPKQTLSQAGRPQAPTSAVYGEDLKTVVGHLVPGRGFVPVGIDPGTIPVDDASAAPAP